jgi:molybdenum cofactor cytidylyltransferase
MIVAMVLAAGQSRRMGTQKLLLPLQGKPMIAIVVDELLRSPVDEVFVVVGKDGDAVRQALAGRNVRFVTNTQPEEEMLQSVRCGLAAMPPETVAAIVALGDQPGISSDVVAELVCSYHASEHGIVVPICGGKRGHPLLFSVRYREEVLTCHDGRGLRGLLDAHPDDVLEVEVGKPGVLEDIDWPEEYERARGDLPPRNNR